MSTFVLMYHPLLPATADSPVRVALKSVDEHEAKGWLQVDPESPSPPAATPYYTREAADSRFVPDAQLPAKMATVASGNNAFTAAQRAASVAAVETAETLAPAGQWDFAAADVTGLPGGVNPTALVDNLPNPFYIAHRMGADQSAEECLTAARIAVAQGAHVIEIDMRLLADGTLVVHHDSTVDRTTTGTGNVADFGIASWLKLKMDHAGLVGGTGWPDEPPLTVERVLREFGNKVALSPQPYVAGAYAAFDKLVTALGIDRRTIIMQPFIGGDDTVAIAAGYRCISVSAAEPTTELLAARAAAGYWGIATNTPVTTPAAVAAAHAVGLKIIPYSPSGHFVRDKMLALGVDGMFTSSPGYLAEGYAKRTRDAFAAQTRVAGTALLNGAGTISFETPNILRITGAQTVRLGYLAPPDGSNFVLDMQARLVSDGGLTTQAFYVFAMMADFFSSDERTTQEGVTLDTSDGYRFSALSVPGASTSLRGVILADNDQSNILTNGPGNYTLNTWTDYRLTVTPTQIKWEQVGVAGSVFLARAEYRPLRYIGLACSGTATAEFRNLVLS